RSGRNRSGMWKESVGRRTKGTCTSRGGEGARKCRLAPRDLRRFVRHAIADAGSGEEGVGGATARNEERIGGSGSRRRRPKTGCRSVREWKRVGGSVGGVQPAPDEPPRSRVRCALRPRCGERGTRSLSPTCHGE